MNAYELADELDACFTKADWEYVNDAVTMLRQQADRIAELEKDLLKYDRLAWDDINKQGDEPYCWRMRANNRNDKDWWLFGRNPNRDEKVSHSAIPLYTTPQIKELNDEEIKKCVIAWVKQIYGNEYVTPLDSHIIKGTKLIRLAEKRIFKNDSL